MAFGILILQLAEPGLPLDEHCGRWLRDFNPDGLGGRGVWLTTWNPGRAKRYETSRDAWLEWQRQSTVLPIRADRSGEANRPLTQYTILIEQLGLAAPAGTPHAEDQA